jgi:hypothetical protein
MAEIPAGEDACCAENAAGGGGLPMVRVHDSQFVRGLYLSLGILALILGGLGVVLPLLPTTPFVLLAAACFARSSEYFHERMLAHRVVGPMIREWREHRAMSRRVKRWAYLLMILTFGFSILLMDATWHRMMLAVAGTALGFFLWRVPVCEVERSPETVK